MIAAIKNPRTGFEQKLMGGPKSLVILELGYNYSFFFFSEAAQNSVSFKSNFLYFFKC